jgi:iron(III) transport system ATP-binding protein
VPDIRLRNVSKAFGDATVLDNIDIDVGDKEFVTLLGPSGCGKTTTLMAIAGFQHPDSGRIVCGDQTFFDGGGRRRPLPAEQRNLGIVFQSYAIWPHMTVAANIGFPLKLRRTKKPEVDRRVAEMLELVELSGFGRQYPHQLSGGQQQRVALARALIGSPSVLLLDEPFSNLDAKLRERSRKWLRALQQEIGMTTIFVTHDQDEALGMSDRVMVMNRGVIEQSGTPEEIYRRPSNRAVAEFVGRCNVLDGRIVEPARCGSVLVEISGTSLKLRAQCPPDTADSGDVVVALRPELIQLSLGQARHANECLADVRSSAFLGDHYEFEVSMGGVSALVQHALPVAGGTALVTVPDLAAIIVKP